MFAIILINKHTFATEYITKGVLVVEDIGYIKNKIRKIIIEFTEEEIKQSINYIVNDKKTKAISH